jgi:hypothetical protein
MVQFILREIVGVLVAVDRAHPIIQIREQVILHHLLPHKEILVVMVQELLVHHLLLVLAVEEQEHRELLLQVLIRQVQVVQEFKLLLLDLPLLQMELEH